MDIVTRFALASDAAQLALLGAACWGFALLCLAMDQWRNRRRSVERLERVGWVPWTSLFLASAVIGGGLLALSLPVVLGRL